MLYRFEWNVSLKYESSYYYNALDLSFVIGSSRFNATIKGYNASEKGWSYSGNTGWLSVTSIEDISMPTTIQILDKSANTTKMSKVFVLDVFPYPFQIGTINDFDIDVGVVVPYTKTYTYAEAMLLIKLNGTIIKPLFTYTGEKIVFTDAEKETIYGIMAYSNSMAFEFYLYTYMSGLSYGNTSKTAYGIITNALPTFDNGVVGVRDADELTSSITNNEILVQFKSNVWVTIPPATAHKGTQISHYDITIGNQSQQWAIAEEMNFGEINQSGAFDVVVTAIDNRGNTASLSTAIVVSEYKEPTVATSLWRKNNYEEETHIIVEAAYSLVDGYNALNSITCEFAKVGEAFDSPILLESNIESILICDNNNAYNFRIVATDKFGTSVAKEYVLPKGKFPLFIDTKMNAVGINAFPLDEDEALRVANGIAVFEDGIALKSTTEGSNKYFILTVDDNGQLSITERGEKRK